MSAWLDMAEEIKTRLESLVALDGVDVVVDRQLSIDSKVKVAVGKAKGACVSILWARSGLDLADAMASEPSYTIRGYFKPAIRDGDTAAAKADDVMEAIVGALTGWHPSDRAHANERLQPAGDIDLVPDKSYLIYEVAYQCRLPIPAPEFKEAIPTP